jgi:hypothetical protein
MKNQKSEESKVEDWWYNESKTKEAKVKESMTEDKTSLRVNSLKNEREGQLMNVFAFMLQLRWSEYIVISVVVPIF